MALITFMSTYCRRHISVDILPPLWDTLLYERGNMSTVIFWGQYVISNIPGKFVNSNTLGEYVSSNTFWSIIFKKYVNREKGKQWLFNAIFVCWPLGSKTRRPDTKFCIILPSQKGTGNYKMDPPSPPIPKYISWHYINKFSRFFD